MNGFLDVDMVDTEAAVTGDPPSSSELVERVGLTAAEVAPLAQFERMALQVSAARDALFAGRPGGSDYHAAVRADAEALLDGEPTGNTAALLAGEQSRWVAVQVAKRARGMARERISGVRTRAALAARTRLRGLLIEIERTAGEGWTHRDNKGQAWTARYAADQLVGQWSWLHAVARWGEGERFTNRGVMPDGKAGGTLVALRQHLDGNQPVTFAAGLEYPDGYLTDAANQQPIRIGTEQAMLLGSRS